MAQPVRARRLTDEEGLRLQQIVRRGKHGSIRVRRAMIIMASASGTLVPAISRLVAADEDTVRDVIHAFNAKGLAALDPGVPLTNVSSAPNERGHADLGERGPGLCCAPLLRCGMHARVRVAGLDGAPRPGPPAASSAVL